MSEEYVTLSVRKIVIGFLALVAMSAIGFLGWTVYFYLTHDYDRLYQQPWYYELGFVMMVTSIISAAIGVVFVLHELLKSDFRIKLWRKRSGLPKAEARFTGDR